MILTGGLMHSNQQFVNAPLGKIDSGMTCTSTMSNLVDHISQAGSSPCSHAHASVRCNADFRMHMHDIVLVMPLHYVATKCSE